MLSLAGLTTISYFIGCAFTFFLTARVYYSLPLFPHIPYVIIISVLVSVYIDINSNLQEAIAVASIQGKSKARLDTSQTLDNHHLATLDIGIEIERAHDDTNGSKDLISNIVIAAQQSQNSCGEHFEGAGKSREAIVAQHHIYEAKTQAINTTTAVTAISKIDDKITSSASCRKYDSRRREADHDKVHADRTFAPIPGNGNGSVRRFPGRSNIGKTRFPSLSVGSDEAATNWIDDDTKAMMNELIVRHKVMRIVDVAFEVCREEGRFRPSYVKAGSAGCENMKEEPKEFIGGLVDMILRNSKGSGKRKTLLMERVLGRRTLDQ